MNYFERKEPVFNDDENDGFAASREPAPTSQKSKKKNDDSPAPQKYRRRKIKKHTLLFYWLNLIFFTLIGFSLLGIDFTLYASSAAGNIFSEFPVLKPEILISLSIIAGVTALIYFCCSGFVIALCLLTSIVMYMFGMAMFNQFANFSSASELTGHSETYISMALALVTFALLFFSNKKLRFFYACAAVFALGAVFLNQNYDKPEFDVTEDRTQASSASQKGKKLINIMMPNAAGYGYIAGMDDKEVNKISRDKLKSLMLGFYTKYGFKLYPNAYVIGDNPYVNAANALNLSVPQNSTENLQLQVMKEGYWQFKKRNNFEVYLKNTGLIDTFKSQGYVVSAYQSHGINLCRKNDVNNVYRCVTRIVNPIDIDSRNFTVVDRSLVILAQWLESSGWFSSFGETIYNWVKSFYSPEQTPVIGVSYKHLYVANSLQTLDKAIENIVDDRGDNAYFIYLDMPSDMFVYDEYCNFKQSVNWLVQNGYSWVERNRVLEKRNAYLTQTMCLYGKLGQFMQNLKNTGDLKDTTVIIQGLNGLNDLIGDKDATLVKDFLNGQVANLAIFSPNSRSLTINKSICSIPDILNNYFNGGKCEEFKGVSSSKTTKKALKDKLDAVAYTSNIAQQALQKYNEWQRVWNQNNHQAPLSFSGTDDDFLPQKKTAPQALPLEEKTINKQKIMSGELKVAPEAKVESLKEMSKEPVDEFPNTTVAE